MTETTVTDAPVTKTPLTRKALILAGAAAGIIIAGGLIVFKKNAEPVEDVEETASAE